MIRPVVAERGFALALIASAAIHAALLPLVVSFASGSVPGYIQPVTETCINAFLVPGTFSEIGKAQTLPGLKPRQADRTVPMGAAASVRPEPNQASSEKDELKLYANIRPSAEPPERPYDSGASLEKPISPVTAILIPDAGVSSGSMGSEIRTAHRESGESPQGKDAGAHISQPEGIDTPQEGSRVRLMKDADAVPRYGDNLLPSYPPLARLRGYQGVAVLWVEVLADGGVGQVGIRRSTGHEILDRTALEAVRSWKFEPGRREGRPVAMSVTVPVRFVLQGNSNLVKMGESR